MADSEASPPSTVSSPSTASPPSTAASCRPSISYLGDKNAPTEREVMKAAANREIILEPSIGWNEDLQPPKTKKPFPGTGRATVALTSYLPNSLAGKHDEATSGRGTLSSVIWRQDDPPSSNNLDKAIELHSVVNANMESLIAQECLDHPEGSEPVNLGGSEQWNSKVSTRAEQIKAQYIKKHPEAGTATDIAYFSNKDYHSLRRDGYESHGNTGYEIAEQRTYCTDDTSQDVKVLKPDHDTSDGTAVHSYHCGK